MLDDGRIIGRDGQEIGIEVSGTRMPYRYEVDSSVKRCSVVRIDVETLALPAER